MKKNFRFLALSAAILSMFTACQREELEQNQKPEELTHTVTFFTGDAGTKTTVDISGGNTAKFSFTEGDIDRITIWENGVKGTVDKNNSSVENGIMTISAQFAGEETAEDKTYTAVLNTYSISTQIVSSNSYDEDADVLVAKPVTTSAASGIKFQFKREVAIAKMTLKGLDAEENINYVSISSSSEAGFAGSFDGKEWKSTESSIEIASQAYMEAGEYIITANASGEAEVWFTCIPQTDATLTVTVESADGDTYTKEFSKPITLAQGDVTGFVVAMVKDAKVNPWVAVDLADIDETMPVVITMAKNNTVYALSLTGTDDQALGTTAASKAPIVTVKDGKLSEKPTSDILWNISNNGGNLTIYPNGVTNEWLYAQDSQNDGVRLGDSTEGGYIWSLDSTTGYLKTNSSETTTRYLGVYFPNTGVPNWRSYKLQSDGSIATNIKDQILCFYTNSSPKTALEAPKNLKVDNKVVTWDVVAGAASYVLNIGTVVVDFTCETNSYEATTVDDEYYDVTVVAVPSDTENYKNSDAATLTDAKFGTPTLSTPEITAGVIEETSVAFSWTKDTRATSGYHWALYNGETLIKEATETSATSAAVTSLGFGTTYTAKVYAVAVDGEKPYVQSATATLDLTTKAKTTISTIVNAGSSSTKYAISDLTVMAVSGKYFVVKDETGIMTAYKSTNATAAVGDIATLEGTYGATNGLNLFTYTSYSKGDTPGVVDYGTPFILNSENISDYTSNSSLKYVKATVSVGSNGSTLSIGSTDVYMRPSSGVSVSEYAGKTITMLGYAFGYDTNYKNVVILATSVEIDQTVPYLAVSPTSKTWESEQKDAAVFTVTTNTEGEKGWTVSPETLDWATIDVDKAAGTITVTPNGANTTETALEATLTVSHAAGTLSETIELKQSGKQSSQAVVTGFNAKWTGFTTADNTGKTSISATSDNTSATITSHNSNNNKINCAKAGLYAQKMSSNDYWLITIPNVTNTVASTTVTVTFGGIKVNDTKNAVTYKFQYSVDGSTYNDFGETYKETTTSVSKTLSFVPGVINKGGTLYIKVLATSGGSTTAGSHYLGTSITVSAK